MNYRNTTIAILFLTLTSSSLFSADENIPLCNFRKAIAEQAANFWPAPVTRPATPVTQPATPIARLLTPARLICLSRPPFPHKNIINRFDAMNLEEIGNFYLDQTRLPYSEKEDKAMLIAIKKKILNGEPLTKNADIAFFNLVSAEVEELKNLLYKIKQGKEIWYKEIEILKYFFYQYSLGIHNDNEKININSLLHEVPFYEESKTCYSILHCYSILNTICIKWNTQHSYQYGNEERQLEAFLEFANDFVPLKKLHINCLNTLIKLRLKKPWRP
jgi:hypothetical protein